MTGEMTAVREKGATSGAGVLATFGYDDLGRRTSLARGNGATTAYSYDAVSRLGSMTHDFGGSATTHDLTLGFAYNPASQIVEATRSNNLYAWTGHGSGTTASTANGLNQLDMHAGASAAYDAKGNLTSEGGRTLGYDSENKLTSIAAPQLGGLLYDPLGRFRALASSSVTVGFDSLGTDLVAARINGGATTERYVFAPGVDEPMVGYDNAGALYYFHADERGSIVATSGSAGSATRTIAYDEYGKPSVFSSRFLYAGKMHFGGVNAYYNNARFYDYKLGRFLQTDPIGYGDGMNMYGYVGGDPVNSTDPTGTETTDAFSSSRPYPIDNDDEWQPLKGPSNADLAGGHSYDRMGMLDIVRVVSGRVDVLAFEREQALYAGGFFGDLKEKGAKAVFKRSPAYKRTLSRISNTVERIAPGKFTPEQKTSVANQIFNNISLRDAGVLGRINLGSGPIRLTRQQVSILSQQISQIKPEPLRNGIISSFRSGVSQGRIKVGNCHDTKKSTARGYSDCGWRNFFCSSFILCRNNPYTYTNHGVR